MTATRQLRSLVAAGRLVAAGCFDALSARMAEVVGFEALYISGFAVEASQFASPDLGLITRSEMAGLAARIAATVGIPIICDVDTGYGDPLNVGRTVREFERAGIAAIQIEDQPDPKRCPLVERRTVLPVADALQRLHAAVAARTDPDFVIIGRTDADEISFDEAVARARAYLDVGVDAVMSPLSGPVEGVPFRKLTAAVQLHWHRRFCAEVGGPAYALSIPDGCTADDVLDTGYRAVILPTLSFRAAATAMMQSLRAARGDGTAATYFEDHPADPTVVGLGLLKLLGLQEALETREQYRFDGGARTS